MNALIRRTADKYYVLTLDGHEIGSDSRSRLERWAKGQGVKQIDYRDEREPEYKVKAWNPQRGEF